MIKRRAAKSTMYSETKEPLVVAWYEYIWGGIVVLTAVRKIRLIDWIIQIYGKVMLEAFMRIEMGKQDIEVAGRVIQIAVRILEIAFRIRKVAVKMKQVVIR